MNSAAFFLPPLQTANLEVIRHRKPVPYRPSNGTEGDIFMSEWCFQCANDSEESPCRILGRVLGNSIGDPAYPSEWHYDADEIPVCSAFVENGLDVPPARCGLTLNLL